MCMVLVSVRTVLVWWWVSLGSAAFHFSCFLRAFVFSLSESALMQNEHLQLVLVDVTVVVEVAVFQNRSLHLFDICTVVLLKDYLEYGTWCLTSQRAYVSIHLAPSYTWVKMSTCFTRASRSLRKPCSSSFSIRPFASCNYEMRFFRYSCMNLICSVLALVSAPCIILEDFTVREESVTYPIIEVENSIDIDWCNRCPSLKY